MTPEFRDLYARVQRLENDLLRRPLIQSQWNADLTLLYVDGGNTLATIGATSWTGIDFASTFITSLPAATPTYGSTYASGIGYGRLYVDGNPQGNELWIVNGSQNRSLIGCPVPTGMVIYGRPAVIGGTSCFIPVA